MARQKKAEKGNKGKEVKGKAVKGKPGLAKSRKTDQKAGVAKKTIKKPTEEKPPASDSNDSSEEAALIAPQPRRNHANENGDDDDGSKEPYVGIVASAFNKLIMSEDPPVVEDFENLSLPPMSSSRSV